MSESTTSLPGPGLEPAASNFIRDIIDEDNRTGKHGGRVHTRFPPEPNGYLHIGHAKSICLNFGLARDYRGQCNLRFDDTNPVKEDPHFVEAIKRDIRWLGFDWQDREFHASDYYEQLFGFAVELVKAGKAYVCSLTEEQVREYRGTVKEPGRPSPDRERPIAESLELLTRMRAGEFPDGKYTLRAKIDMSAANMKMRDPLIYRIRHAHHHRTGDTWKIYPFYDFAHGLSDALEGITHSICTLEFKDNRDLYDWFVDNVSAPCKPQQIEFAKLKLNYTVMGKRKLVQLVQQGKVSGWDDPRMPTISGMRRRGYTPEAIRAFAEGVGVAKRDSVVDFALLEFHLREDLNRRAPRFMGVLRPLKLTITNYPEGQFEHIECENNPEDPAAGTRQVPFGRTLWIEADDFRADAPKKWFRLAPGAEVRLKHAYLIVCDEVIKNDAGEVVELRCSYDPKTRGGEAPDGRKVRGTLHWVSAAHAIGAEMRIYDKLYLDEFPEEGEGDFLSRLNPNSLEILSDAKLEPAVAGACRAFAASSSATAISASIPTAVPSSWFSTSRSGCATVGPNWRRSSRLEERSCACVF